MAEAGSAAGKRAVLAIGDAWRKTVEAARATATQQTDTSTQADKPKGDK